MPVDQGLFQNLRRGWLLWPPTISGIESDCCRPLNWGSTFWNNPHSNSEFCAQNFPLPQICFPAFKVWKAYFYLPSSCWFRWTALWPSSQRPEGRHGLHPRPRHRSQNTRTRLHSTPEIEQDKHPWRDLTQLGICKIVWNVPPPPCTLHVFRK